MRRHWRTACLLCSWLQKQHGDNTFRRGPGAWRNSSLCPGQITPSCKRLWWQQGLHQPTFTGCNWAFPSSDSGITAALWMVWGSPPAILCQIFSRISLPCWSPGTLSPSFLWAWHFRGEFCYSTFSKSNCVPASGVLLSVALLNSEQTISTKNSTRHLMTKACRENVPWNSTESMCVLSLLGLQASL